MARRARAIERRWIPRHEAALAALELGLEETEREEAVRLRLLARRRTASEPRAGIRTPCRVVVGSLALLPNPRKARKAKKKHRLTSRHAAVQEAIELFVADATS